VKVYVCQHQNGYAVAVSYGRGHAVKMIAKALEAEGFTLTKQDKVDELTLETKKGYARLLPTKEA